MEEPCNPLHHAKLLLDRQGGLRLSLSLPEGLRVTISAPTRPSSATRSGHLSKLLWALRIGLPSRRWLAQQVRLLLRSACKRDHPRLHPRAYFHRGIYFSDAFQKSIAYVRGNADNGDSYILLCEVSYTKSTFPKYNFSLFNYFINLKIKSVFSKF